MGDEHVHGDAAGWPGDQRINIKTADEVACVGDGRRNRYQIQPHLPLPGPSARDPPSAKS